MYTKKRIKSLLGLLALGRPKYDSVQLYDYSKPKYEKLFSQFKIVFKI